MNKLLVVWCLFLVMAGCAAKDGAKKPEANPYLTMQGGGWASLRADNENYSDINHYFDAVSNDVLARIIRLRFSSGHISRLGEINKLPNLETLDVSYSGPPPFDTAALPGNLKSLHIATDSVTSLDTAGMPRNLESLSVSGNVTSLDIAALPRNLKSLRIIAKIPSVKAAELPRALTDLFIYGSLTSFDTKGLPETLRSLNLEMNHISFFDTNYIPASLEKLTLTDNPLSGTFEITQNMSNLRYLVMVGVPLHNVTGLHNLKRADLSLHFSQCPIKYFEIFTELENVKYLSLSVPDDFTDAEIELLHKKIKGKNPAIEMLDIERYVEGMSGLEYQFEHGR